MLRSFTRASGHSWTFFRRGGLIQVMLQSGADLMALGQLDPKLWVALSCPVHGLEIDAKTLALIDSDGDGHIRVLELVAAVRWAGERLVDPGSLLKGEPALSLAAINAATNDGKPLAQAVRHLLSTFGRAESGQLRVEDFTDPSSLFPAGKIHGEGVLTPEVAEDPDTKLLIENIVACTGGKKSASGAIGATPDQVKAFLKEAAAFVAWSDRGRVIFPLGEKTVAAEAAVAAVQAKIEDYFARTSLAAFDPRSQAALNRTDADYAALASHDLTVSAASSFPLALVEANKPLPLTEGVNPAWSDAIATFQQEAVAPLLGPGHSFLTAENWAELKAKLAPHAAWLSGKEGGSVEALGAARVREILSGSGRAGLEALLATDQALSAGFAATSDVERLIRYHRDLRALLHNFVNFADFYSKSHGAIFQAGTLYLDSRSCELCVKVEDPAAHSTLAAMSRLCIAYLDCRRAGATMKIAASFTQGDSNYLFVGRNGVFYDRSGSDWDATITKMIENPISIRQGFFAPYKRVASFVEGQFAKFAAAQDLASSAALNQGVTAAAHPADQKAPSQGFDIAKFAGIFAAIGLALGAMGGAIASVSVGFMKLPTHEKPLAVIGVLLLISGPSMLLAAIKLRQRNLGPLLEGCGWAINGRVKINRVLGNALTAVATLPPGSHRRLDDPYRDKAQSRRRTLLAVAIVLLTAALVTAKVRGTWPFAG